MLQDILVFIFIHQVVPHRNRRGLHRLDGVLEMENKFVFISPVIERQT